MNFVILAAILLVSMVGATGEAELSIVKAVGEGTFYNCSKHDPSSSADAEALARAEANCTDTYWCIWEGASKKCQYDSCLAYKPDNGGDCPSNAAGIKCKLFYLVDTVDCTTGLPRQTDRYCRVDDESQSGYRKKSLLGSTCFYEDLKSINGGDASATRSCGNKICAWVHGSGGDYCSEGGGEDCSSFGTPEAICPCLTKAHCDLYPRCVVSGQNCIPDPCNKATPTTNVAGGACQIGVAPASYCKSRIEWVFDDTDGLTQKLFCSNASTTPNECYFAVKSTLVKPTQSDGNSHPECWYRTYDETICTDAKALDESANPPAVPAADAVSCQLVDIAAGYFSAEKYCTDGNRVVPAPNASSFTHVPTFLAFLVVILISLSLL